MAADGKLTALRVKKETRLKSHGDGGGLYLRIAKGGRRSWMFRYKMHGKPHWMGLGPEGDYTLAEAREAARECRRQLRAGVDPIAAREAARAAAVAESSQTFEVVADKYIEFHKAGWRNAKHGKQWRATLELYAFPVIGTKPVQVVTVAHVMEILEPIWATKTETASRVRGRIENVIDHAIAMKWRTGENPARWKGHLDKVLPARSKVATVKHHAALSADDMQGVMSKLASSSGMGALCLRLAILTAARSGEARGARWNEISLDSETWTVPASRMKAGKEHKVPLSKAAMEILREVNKLTHEPDGLVFPGGRVGSPLSDVALNKALDAAGAPEVTVHGMRSTFRDWVAVSTNTPREIAEAALAHMNRDKVEASYLRSDRFEKRKALMEEWALFATRPPMAAHGRQRQIPPR